MTVRKMSLAFSLERITSKILQVGCNISQRPRSQTHLDLYNVLNTVRT